MGRAEGRELGDCATVTGNRRGQWYGGMAGVVVAQRAGLCEGEQAGAVAAVGGGGSAEMGEGWLGRAIAVAADSEE